MTTSQPARTAEHESINPRSNVALSRVVAALLLALGTALLVFTLHNILFTVMLVRMPIDETLYTDIGRIIARGGVPFREIWDLKPPVHNYLIAPFILVFGNTMLAIRITVLFIAGWFVTVTTLLAWHITRDPMATVLAACASVVYGAWQAHLEGFNPVIVMTVLAITAMLVAVVGRGRPLWMLVSGLLLAASFMSKQVVVFEGFAALAFAAYFAPSGERVRAAVFVIVGGLLGIAIAVGLALWAGVLESLWLNAFYNSFLYTVEPEGQGWHFNAEFVGMFRQYFLGQSLPFLLPLTVMMIPAAVVLLRDKQTRPVTLVVLVWVFATFLGAMIGRSMRRSYFLETLGALILLNALAVPTYRRLKAHWQVALVVLLAVSLYANGILGSVPANAVALANAQWQPPDASPLIDAERETAQVLADLTEPDECFWQWDTIGTITYLADRRPCTSIPAAHVVMIRESFDIHRLRADYMNEMFANRPRIHTRYSVWGYFPELERFADRYRGELLYDGLAQHNTLDIYAVDMSPFRAHYANFGAFEMIGYDLYSPDAICAGEQIRTSMTWRVQTPPTRYYNLFVQLLTEDQTARIVGTDAQPHDRLPTVEWSQPNMIYLGDTLTLDVAEEVIPGTYLLVTGFYDVETFERLPVTDAAGNTLPGDYVPLTTLIVEACE